jgi:hypothetical protein
MEIGTFKIEIDRKSIVEQINNSIQGHVKKLLSEEETNIKNSLEKYFKKSFRHDNNSDFENSLYYLVEISTRKAFETAIEELGFQQKMVEKAKEILTDDDFIQKLAEESVRKSMGLPQK